MVCGLPDPSVLTLLRSSLDPLQVGGGRHEVPGGPDPGYVGRDTVTVVWEGVGEEEAGRGPGAGVLEGRVGGLGVGRGEEVRVGSGEPRGGGHLGRGAAPQDYRHHRGVDVDEGFGSEERSPGLPDGRYWGGTGVVLRHLQPGRGGSGGQGGGGGLERGGSGGGDQLGPAGRRRVVSREEGEGGDLVDWRVGRSEGRTVTREVVRSKARRQCGGHW